MTYGECINPEESGWEKAKNAFPRRLDKQEAAQWKTAIEYQVNDKQEKERLFGVVDDIMCDLEITQAEGTQFRNELKKSIEKQNIHNRMSNYTPSEAEKTPEKPIIDKGEVDKEEEKTKPLEEKEKIQESSPVGPIENIAQNTGITPSNPQKTGKPEKGKISKQVGTSDKRKIAAQRSQDENNPERNNIDKMVKDYEIAGSMQQVIEYLESPESKLFVKKLISEHLIGYKFRRKTHGKNYEIITLREENMNRYIDNFNILDKTLIDVESDGRVDAANPKSSARGIGQTLIGNGKWDTDSKGKEFWRTSSIETYTNNIIRSGIKLDFLPTETIKEPSNLNPLNWSMEQQVQFIMATLVSHHQQITNGVKERVSMKDHLGLVLEDRNTWAIKKIYEEFWHTNTDQKTKKNLNNALDYYASK